MSRGLSAGNLTAVGAAHIRPIVFIEFHFDGGTERTHNAVGTYTWGGFSWTGIGAFGDIGPLEEGLDLSPFGVSMQLNALNDDLRTTATSETVFNRRTAIHIGYLDENGVLVADPQERWSGLMDHISMRLGRENALLLQCESDLRFFQRANGSLFTHEDQERLFSGDIGFEFLDQMIDAKVNWGAGGVFASPGRPQAPRRLPGNSDSSPSNQPTPRQHPAQR